MSDEEIKNNIAAEVLAHKEFSENRAKDFNEYVTYRRIVQAAIVIQTITLIIVTIIIGIKL